MKKTYQSKLVTYFSEKITALQGYKLVTHYFHSQKALEKDLTGFQRETRGN